MENQALSVYVLKCEQDKYYVGGTARAVGERVLEHFAEHGAGWTKVYPPVDVLEIITPADRFDEDKYTKIYMEKYGIENVRGGSYVQLKLHDFQLKSLDLEFATALGACFNCGQPGHYANSCPNIEKAINAEKIVKMVKSHDKKSHVAAPAVCERCGRDHKLADCYTNFHDDGTALLCGRCGRDHKTTECYAAKDIKGKVIDKAPLIYSDYNVTYLVNSRPGGKSTMIEKIFRKLAGDNEVETHCKRCGKNHSSGKCRTMMTTSGKKVNPRRQN